jgi:dipeptidyl aminopeptidase/acylaminoacyl peptidase
MEGKRFMCPNTECYGFERITVLDPDTLTKQVLVEIPSHLDLVTRQGIVNVAWSPDGSKLGFIHFSNSWSKIRVIDIASRQITEIGAGYDPLTWSPDGKRVSSASYSQEEGWGINILTLDGKTIRTFYENWERIDGIDWSSDGSKLAVTARVSQDNGPLIRNLYILDVNGGQVTQLMAESGGDYTHPRWSPDDSLLGVTVHPSDTSNSIGIVLLYPVDGKKQTEITVDYPDIEWLWSRTGRTILLKVTDTVVDKIGIFNLETNELKYVEFPPQIESILEERDVWLGDIDW